MFKNKLKQIAKAGIKSAIKEVANLRYSKLNSVKFGLAGGIVLAFCVLVCSLVALDDKYTMIGMVPYIFYGAFGYSLTAKGILLGTVYSFFDGFLITFLFAWIYNKLL